MPPYRESNPNTMEAVSMSNVVPSSTNNATSISIPIVNSSTILRILKGFHELLAKDLGNLHMHIDEAGEGSQSRLEGREVPVRYVELVQEFIPGYIILSYLIAVVGSLCTLELLLRR